MKLLRWDLSAVLIAAFLVLAFHPNPAGAKDLPSDLCSLLPASQLQKTLGQPFGDAIKTAAPAPYAGQPSGTNCRYTGQKGGSQEVIFIVYVDRSPADAKQNFDKLSAWYPSISKPAGIGDSAYVDKSHAIHVLKGSVRYFISISSGGSGAADRQIQDLATSVAAQI